MSETPELRASDADRERTVAILRDHSVEDRLTLDEFSSRMEQAYSARTLGDLETLTADLPAVGPVAPRKGKRTTIVAFGSTERRGRWGLGRHLVLVAFGNADVDLREAQLVEESPSLTAFVLFGNLDLYVPDEIELDLGGISVFGARGDSGDDPPRSGAPLVRVRLFVLFGNADVWRVPRELARASWREVIRVLSRGRSGMELPSG